MLRCFSTQYLTYLVPSSTEFDVPVFNTHAIQVVGTDNEGGQDADQVAQKDRSHLDFCILSAIYIFEASPSQKL